MAPDTSVKSGIILVTKNDSDVTISCEIIVLRKVYKKVDILNFDDFCLVLNNRRTGQS